MVMVIAPPSFQVDERANEIPARQVPDVEEVTGVLGVSGLLEELALALVLEVLIDGAEESLEHEIGHSQLDVSEQEGEPPPPQGTWR